MLFSSKDQADKNDKKAPQKRTIVGKALRFAFNPELGTQVRPMQESVDIFVNILAMCFIALKMFPANHPAYLGANGARLTLPLLLSTVWHDLEFTKENIPKILIFFSVIASFIFAALAFVTLMMSLFGSVFINRAHAAGYYTSDAGDDIALQWIRFLRGGDITGDFFTAFAQPLMWAGPLQGALVSALGFYSQAILIVAAVILFYHLTSMTVETAHEGVVMGKKANQLWAPIRLVVAIGLLVPIGGGLNSGQYIIFKVTEWGSGLASNVWSIILGGFEAGEGVASVPQYAYDVVYNTFLTGTCSKTLDAYQCNGGKASVQQTDQDAKSCAKKDQLSATGFTGSRAEEDKVNVLNSQKCGHHSFNQTAKGSGGTAQAVQSNAQSCFDQMQQQTEQYGEQESKHLRHSDVGGDNQPLQKNDGKLDQIAADYMNCLAGGLPIPQLAGVFAMSSEWGWLSAGAVLSAISQAESDANDLGALIPSTQAPDFGSGGDVLMTNEVLPITNKAAAHVNMVSQGGGGGGGGAIGSDRCAASRGMLIQQAAAMRQQGNAQNHFLDRIFQVVDWLAAWNCVWVSMPPAFGTGNFDVGIMFIGANPIAEMARLGQACINTAYDAFDIMVNLSVEYGGAAAGTSAAAGSASAQKSGNASLMQLTGDNLKGALTTINGIMAIITNMFFVSGVLLAYYVPLIPFIAFLFSAMSWVLAVLEAVVAMPLLALAHLTVQGEGLPGQMAKAGYYFIFQIALKPVLMVFGLALGLLVFYAAVSYMNLFYMMAISTAGGIATSHLFLSRLVYNALYVIIIYMAANSAFKAIHLVPEHANKWLGAQSYHFAHMGEPQQVGGVLQSGASQAISGTTSALQQGGLGGAMALGGGGGIPGSGNIGGVVSGQQMKQIGGGTGNNAGAAKAAGTTGTAHGSGNVGPKAGAPPTNDQAGKPKSPGGSPGTSSKN